MTWPGAHSLIRAELGLCPRCPASQSCPQTLVLSHHLACLSFSFQLGEGQELCWGWAPPGKKEVAGSVVADSEAGDQG